MNDIIALVGNPNCGKTTLFNALTGTYQKVGNWTGVTVEKKEGEYKKNKRIKIVDLPGLYALKTGANDETVAYKYLIKTPPKVIINVVDGTNLERNLYLTTELTTLKIPMVIAVNMCDQIEKKGDKLNDKELSKLFGVPVIPVSALKNFNVDELINVAINNEKKPFLHNLNDYKGKTTVNKRYDFIEKNIKNIINKPTIKLQTFTEKADNVLMHRVWGIPIFFAVMVLVYFLSINIGGLIGKKISYAFEVFSKTVEIKLIGAGVSEWIISLLCNAVISSIGGVTSFLPQILVLFALMAIIEESGYAARVAFLLDRFFRSFGLGGKSLLPMIVSCGCTVTGIMATRTIEGENERRMTVFLSPFMPCGAKTAVFAWFSTVFFSGSALIAASMYFLGILCVGIFGIILKRFKAFKSNNGGFLMEIPPLRFPSGKDVLFVLIEKVKEFTTKAGLIVFAVSVFLWLLMSVGVSGYVGSDIEKSFLFVIGNALKYLFYPLGFGSWQASVAIISGFFAKEAVVETLSLISQDVHTVFNSAYSAYAFMAFILLSPPCIASLATAHAELGKKWFLGMLLFQTLSAYIVSFVINSIGFLIERRLGLLLSVLIVIIITLSVFYAIKYLKKSKCRLCKNCKKGEKCQRVKRFTI